MRSNQLDGGKRQVWESGREGACFSGKGCSSRMKVDKVVAPPWMAFVKAGPNAIHAFSRIFLLSGGAQASRPGLSHHRSSLTLPVQPLRFFRLRSIIPRWDHLLQEVPQGY